MGWVPIGIYFTVVVLDWFVETQKNIVIYNNSCINVTYRICYCGYNVKFNYSLGSVLLTLQSWYGWKTKITCMWYETGITTLIVRRTWRPSILKIQSQPRSCVIFAMPLAPVTPPVQCLIQFALFSTDRNYNPHWLTYTSHIVFRSPLTLCRASSDEYLHSIV